MAVAAEMRDRLAFSEAAAALKQSKLSALEDVNDVIVEHLSSSVPLIPEVARHLIGAGGKRLRPLLTLAAADLCRPGCHHAKLLAGAVELIHVATLLHDDVVDDSGLRRGLKTANVVFGNKESVLVGDFLFARAFELMVKTDSIRVLKILSAASSTIAEGEVLQLATQFKIDTLRHTYFDVIRAKTAALFAAATQAGAVVASANAEQEVALTEYGMNFGIAYQVVDDALDYQGTAAEIGKSTGDDFREGKMTLPVILALEHARTQAERDFWKRTIGERIQRDGDFHQAQELMHRDRIIDRALVEAEGYAEAAVRALSVFPMSNERASLEDLATSSAARRA